MATDYLLYWKLSETKNYIRNGETLDYAVSKQFASRRVGPGDRIWIVTGASASLELVGKIEVDAVVDRSMAARILGRADLYGTSDAAYVVNKERGRNRMRRIGLTGIAGLLEFVDATGRPVRALDIGKIQDPRNKRYGFGQALQSMRRVSAETARMLSERIAA